MGSEVALDEPLLTLESDKATMDVPAETAGTVTEIRVAVGDTVSRGTPILVVTPSEGACGRRPPRRPSKTGASERVPSRPQEAPGGRRRRRSAEDRHVGLVVLGAGPGGYTAAFRAADLGLEVLVVDARDTLGGVCLNVGCIPSKALLHAAKVIAETKEMSEHGVKFGAPEIDLDELRTWKDGVVGRLTGGLKGLAKQRKVSTLQGPGRFLSPHRLEVTAPDGTTTVVGFDQVIVAAGSEPVRLPFVPHDDPRVLDSTSALEIADVPERLLVLGGGIIGLEMATVYAELGSRITVVELMDQLIPGADKDIVGPLAKHIGARYEDIHLSTKVTGVEATEKGLVVSFEGKKAPGDRHVRRRAGGRRATSPRRRAGPRRGRGLGRRARLRRRSTRRCGRTSRTCSRSATSSASRCSRTRRCTRARSPPRSPPGRRARSTPAASRRSPTPTRRWRGSGSPRPRRRRRGLSYGSGTFPWAASGRSLSLGRSEGVTKVLFDTETDRILGAGIVGPAAGDLIAEAALAIEMGADAADIGLTIHPHPTLSETIGMAAEAFEGTLTDLYLPKKAGK